MKIVQLEPIGFKTETIQALKSKFATFDHEFVFFDKKPATDAEIVQKTVYADIIIISNLAISETIIRSCHKLKMISVAFTGVDHLPIELCREKGIIVSNAAGYSNHAVAELTIGSAINLLRKLKWADEQTREGKDRAGFLGSELYGKTFGIIGLGQIGQEVAHLASAFGCRVLAHSRTLKNIANIEFSQLEYLLKESDILSIHVPLTKDTKHLINRTALDLMKQDAILINTARGPVVDYKALSEALAKKKIAGAAIDVYEKEPPLTDHILFGSPNTILLPHIGYATKEAIELRGKIVIDNILHWLDGNPQNVMN